MNRRLLRRLVFALLLNTIVVPHLGHTAAAAPQQPLRIAARFGLGGLHRLGEWMPVLVELENSGPAVDIDLTIPLGPQPGVWTRVAMPTNSRKRLFLYVPLRGTDFIAAAEMAANSNRTLRFELQARVGGARLPFHTHTYSPTERATYLTVLVDEDEVPRALLDGKTLNLFLDSEEEEQEPLDSRGPAPPRSVPPFEVRLADPRQRMTVPRQMVPRQMVPRQMVPRQMVPRQMAPRQMARPQIPALAQPSPPRLTRPSILARRMELTLAQLRAEEIPDNPAGLGAADCLTMRPSTWIALDAAQRRAVRTWVEQGGALLLFGGRPAELNHGVTQDLAPVHGNGARVVEALPALQNWLMQARALTAQISSASVTGAYRFNRQTTELPEAQTPPVPLRGRFLLNELMKDPAAQNVLVEGDLPLIVMQRRGFGGVSYCSLPLTSEQWREWPSRGEFWLRLLAETVERLQRARISDVMVRGTAAPRYAGVNLGDDPSIAGFLRRVRGVRPPSVWALGTIAALYVLVFGPVNVLLIRRTRRSERGWLLTPGLSAAFTLFLLVCGYAWGGGQHTINQFSLLEARSGTRSAHEEMVAAFFSPRHGRFDLSFDDPCVFLEDKTAEEEARGQQAQRTPAASRYTPYPFGQFGTAASDQVAEKFPPAANASAVAQTGNACRWTGIPLSVWNLRRYHAFRDVALEGPVSVTLQRDLAGTVRNESGVNLRDALLVAGRRRCALGDLASGVTRDVSARDFQMSDAGAAMGSFETFDDLFQQLPQTVFTRTPVLLLARWEGASLRLNAGKGVNRRTDAALAITAQFADRR